MGSATGLEAGPWVGSVQVVGTLGILSRSVFSLSVRISTCVYGRDEEEVGGNGEELRCG